MKDIAHRGLDSECSWFAGAGNPETSSRVIRDEGENLSVSFSRLGTPARNIDLREQRLPFLLSEMQNRSGQPFGI